PEDQDLQGRAVVPAQGPGLHLAQAQDLGTGIASRLSGLPYLPSCRCTMGITPAPSSRPNTPTATETNAVMVERLIHFSASVSLGLRGRTKTCITPVAIRMRLQIVKNFGRKAAAGDILYLPP